MINCKYEKPLQMSNLHILTKDTLYYIFSKLRADQWLKCSSLNSEFKSLINNENFWKYQICIEFGEEIIKNLYIDSYKKIYYELYQLLDMDGQNFDYKKHFCNAYKSNQFYKYRCLKFIDRIYKNSKDMEKIRNKYSSNYIQLYNELKNKLSNIGYAKIILQQGLGILSKNYIQSNPSIDEFIICYYLYGIDKELINNSNISNNSDIYDKYHDFISKRKICYNHLNISGDKIFEIPFKDNKIFLCHLKSLHKKHKNIIYQYVVNYFCYISQSSYLLNKVFRLLDPDSCFKIIFSSSNPYKYLHNLNQNQLFKIVTNDYFSHFISKNVHNFNKFPHDVQIYLIRKFWEKGDFKILSSIYNVVGSILIIESIKNFKFLLNKMDNNKYINWSLYHIPDIFEHPIVISKLIIQKKKNLLQLLFDEGFNIQYQNIIVWNVSMQQFIQIQNINSLLNH